MMQFVRGNSFDFVGPVTLAVDGVVVSDMTGYSVASQVRGARLDNLMTDLTCEFVSRAPPVLRLFDPTSTLDWPLGKARIDAKFTLPDGRQVSTLDFEFVVRREVTR